MQLAAFLPYPSCCVYQVAVPSVKVYAIVMDVLQHIFASEGPGMRCSDRSITLAFTLEILKTH